jgi:hypothetical protein
MSLTWKPSVIGQAWKAILEADTTLGLEQVSYGNTEDIYETPSVTINVDSVKRDLYATGGNTLNSIQVEFFVHFSSFDDDEWNRIQCDELTEAVIDFLETDTTLGGLVTYGYCSQIDPIGATPGRDDFIKTGRIVWTATSRTRIG